MTNTVSNQAGKGKRCKGREKCFIYILWNQIKNWDGVTLSNFVVRVENKFPIKYNARDSEGEGVREFWVRKLLFRSFSGPACVSRWGRLASRLSPPVVLSALETSTPAVLGFGFVGVAAVYKAQIPRDPTCSAVLHTGTTGSHGELGASDIIWDSK